MNLTSISRRNKKKSKLSLKKIKKRKIMKQKNKEISKSQKNNNIDKSLPRHGDRKSKTQRQKINMKEEVEEEEKN